MDKNFEMIFDAYIQMLEESTYNPETNVLEAPRSIEEILREKYGPDFEEEMRNHDS